MAQATLPPWIQTLRDRDSQFADAYLAQERISDAGAAGTAHTTGFAGAGSAGLAERHRSRA